MFNFKKSLHSGGIMKKYIDFFCACILGLCFGLTLDLLFAYHMFFIVGIFSGFSFGLMEIFGCKVIEEAKEKIENDSIFKNFK